MHEKMLVSLKLQELKANLFTRKTSVQAENRLREEVLRGKLVGQYRKVSEEPVYQNGTFTGVNEFIDGWHPQIPGGQPHTGWAGEPQTKVYVTRLKPYATVVVDPKQTIREWGEEKIEGAISKFSTIFKNGRQKLVTTNAVLKPIK